MARMVKAYKILMSSLLAIVMLSFLSCVKERQGASELDAFTMRFFTHTPSMSKQQSVSESLISQIDALVFVQNGTQFVYAYSVQGTAITDIGNNTTTFDLSLFAEKKAIKIYVFANAHDAIANGGLSVGDSDVVVKSKITTAFTSAGITGNFPMWAEYISSVGLIPSTPPPSVNMTALRAIARADVTATDVADVFTMTSIQIYRANSLIQLTPESYSQSTVQVSSPSIPQTSTSTINTIPIAVTENSSMEELYVPEAAAPAAADLVSKACCIVVGGRYNGNSVTTYYRIDFNATAPGEILRNNLYTFNVTSVTSDGWKTPDEAANNIPSNITVVAEDWTDNINAIGIGGQSFFWIKTKTDSTTNTANSFAYFQVSTNILDYTLQWCDSSGVPQGVPAFTLQNSDFSVSKGRNSVIVEALKDNPTGSGPKKTYVLINAGRAQIVITIVQPDK